MKMLSSLVMIESSAIRHSNTFPSLVTDFSGSASNIQIIRQTLAQAQIQHATLS